MGRFMKGKYKKISNGEIFYREDVLLVHQNAKKNRGKNC